MILRRDLGRLTGQLFDIAVVGGGVYGACVAHDAALRGLSVALLEKADFGSGTSANCMKIMHGGLRYLKDGRPHLVRKMIRERKAWLRIAPHLVRPLPFLMPTYAGAWPYNRPVLAAALHLNDGISLDRNRGLAPQQALPSAQMLSRDECLRLVPGLDAEGLTGGGVWHDALITSPERLQMALLLSAAANGAALANHVRVTGYLRTGQRVTGIRARDEMTGNELAVRARLVINTAGPWTDDLLEGAGLQPVVPEYVPSGAMNLVTRRIPLDHALGLESHYTTPDANGQMVSRKRALFLVPWEDRTLVGTIHAPTQAGPDERWVDEKTIVDLLAEVNQAFPGAYLRREDVYHVLQGYLPAEPGDNAGSVRLVRAGRIHDHAVEDGIEGMLSVVSVKYTTARYQAEQVVDRAYKKLGKAPVACRTERVYLHGGDLPLNEAFVEREATRWKGQFDPDWIRRLLGTYGTAYRDVVAYAVADGRWAEPLAENTPITRAEVLHGVRAEMGLTLADVVLRRTALGTAGAPSEAALWNSARILADELGWERQRIEREIAHVLALYAPYGGRMAGRRPVSEVVGE